MPEMQQHHLSLHSSPPRARDREPNSGPRPPAPIPPWVAVHVGDGHDSQALLSSPAPTVPNTRHHRPAPATSKPGRKWDHLRSAEPAFLSAPVAEQQERWANFVHSGPQSTEGPGRVVGPEWMRENMPDLHPEWASGSAPQDATPNLTGIKGLMHKGKWLMSTERQEKTMMVFWRLLLKNPYVPLFFRAAILVFSAAALANAASIYVRVRRVNADADPNNQCSGRASTYMAIIVGCIALPYLGYVTWDEYMNKPLGLRSVAAKISLLLCDMYFVVFAAANLSLAFDALVDHRWACYDFDYGQVPNVGQLSGSCPNNASICSKQKSLSGVLLCGLVAWLATFSISIMRVVEKLKV